MELKSIESVESAQVVGALSALAHPIRLQVFRALVVAGAAGLSPGTMAQIGAIPAPTLSFHLKELLHAGLVTQQRLGRHLIYRAAFGRMNALIAYLSENCCAGSACEVAATTPFDHC